MVTTATRVLIHYVFHMQREFCLITTIFLYQFNLYMGWVSEQDEKLNPATVID